MKLIDYWPWSFFGGSSLPMKTPPVSATRAKAIGIQRHLQPWKAFKAYEQVASN